MKTFTRVAADVLPHQKIKTETSTKICIFVDASVNRKGRLTYALQFGQVVNVSVLTVALVAAHSVAAEASFAYLLAKQSALVCVCGDETS